MIDSIIASSPTPGVRIKVEATVIHDKPSRGQRKNPVHITLDTIDVESLRNGPTCTGGSHVEEYTADGEGFQLPSPTNTDSHSPRAADDPRQQGQYGRDPEGPSEVPGEEDASVPSRISTRRRKTVGGLSIPRISTAPSGSSGEAPSEPTTRQLQTGHDHFRKRRRFENGPKLEQSTVDKLTEGIWKELHNPNSLVLDQKFPEILQGLRGEAGKLDLCSFDVTTTTCRQITEGARTGRALEVIMQAHWVDSYDAQLASLADSRIYLKPSEQKRATLAKACELFKWTEKELRNRMSVSVLA